MEHLEHSVVVGFVLYVLAAEAILLAACWRLFGPRPGDNTVSTAFATSFLFGQALIPLSWLGLKWAWAQLSLVQQADAIAVLHFGFIVPVVLLQVLIVVGGFLRWRWVRHFGFRIVHLGAIALVVIQAAVDHECPVNEFERARRGGDLANLEGASAIGRFANRAVYQRRPLAEMLIQYAIFGTVVVASWYAVRPRWPGPSKGEG